VYGETRCPSDIERDVAYDRYWKKTVGEQPPSGSRSISTIDDYETLSRDDHRNIQPHLDNAPCASHEKTPGTSKGVTEQGRPHVRIPQT